MTFYQLLDKVDKHYKPSDKSFSMDSLGPADSIVSKQDGLEIGFLQIMKELQTKAHFR